MSRAQVTRNGRFGRQFETTSRRCSRGARNCVWLSRLIVIASSLPQSDADEHCDMFVRVSQGLHGFRSCQSMCCADTLHG